MIAPVALALWDDDAELVRAIDAPDVPLRVVRRCADVGDALAAVFAGLCTMVVLDTRLDGVDRTVVQRIEREGAVCLLLAEPYEQLRLASPSTAVLAHGATATEIVQLLLVRHRSHTHQRARETPSESSSFPLNAPPPPPAPPPAWLEDDDAPSSEVDDQPGQPQLQDRAAVDHRQQEGKILMVWGPHGAPGRSSIAASLAHLFAQTERVVLVDADTEAPSQLQALGLPDDSSGLATACRLATHGRLDLNALNHCLTPTPQGFALMSGVGRQGRWRELPSRSLDVVWEQLRRHAQWIIVDVSGGYEEPIDDGLGTDTWRYGVIESLLRTCDHVVSVGQADPVGMRRLITFLAETTPLFPPHTRGHVVVNRVPARVGMLSGDSQTTALLATCSALSDPLLLPDTPSQAANALLHARCLSQEAPDSTLTARLRTLANRINPRVSGYAPSRRRWPLIRARRRSDPGSTQNNTPGLRGDSPPVQHGKATTPEQTVEKNEGTAATRRASKGRHRK